MLASEAEAEALILESDSAKFCGNDEPDAYFCIVALLLLADSIGIDFGRSEENESEADEFLLGGGAGSGVDSKEKRDRGSRSPLAPWPSPKACVCTRVNPAFELIF